MYQTEIIEIILIVNKDLSSHSSDILQLNVQLATTAGSPSQKRELVLQKFARIIVLSCYLLYLANLYF